MNILCLRRWLTKRCNSESCNKLHHKNHHEEARPPRGDFLLLIDGLAEVLGPVHFFFSFGDNASDY